MTKWGSNRSIYNEDKSGILPGAKFEFDDRDWAKVNLHADLPDGARHELESAIYLYLVSCLRKPRIKDELKSLAKKAAALSLALDNLSTAARRALMSPGYPILLNKCKSEVADLRTKTWQVLGTPRHGADPSARNRLIRDAAMIYNGYAKTSFKEFEYKYIFISELLEISGVSTKQKPPGPGHAAKGRRDGERAINLQIQACCRQNSRLFSRRRDSHN